MVTERSLSTNQASHYTVPLIPSLRCLRGSRRKILLGFKQTKELLCPWWHIFVGGTGLIV
jgi:hypothetical protein